MQSVGISGASGAPPPPGLAAAREGILGETTSSF